MRPFATKHYAALVQMKLTAAEQREKLAQATKTREDSATSRSDCSASQLLRERPAANDTDAWLKRLEGPADPDAGRRMFEHPEAGGCSAAIASMAAARTSGRT